MAIYTWAPSIVCSVKCIGSSFRLLVAVCTTYGCIKANKICSGMKVDYLVQHIKTNKVCSGMKVGYLR